MLPVCRSTRTTFATLAAAAVAAGGASARAQSISAGPFLNPANGHQYYLLTNSNWTSARAFALSIGADLVTINDAAENTFVNNTFAPLASRLWIGLNDAASEGQFVWASGAPVTFTNWEAGEPNNGGGTGENWVHIYTNNGRWNDVRDIAVGPAIGPLNGVIELPGPPICPPAMNPRQTFTVGNSPFDIALGDFNGDGRIDAVTADYDGGTMSVLLGNQNGTFQAASTTLIGANTFPSGIAVGDFNRDGRLDVVTCNFGTSNVSVRLGNGNGTFGAVTNFAAGANPMDVQLADLNRDGALDIIVANQTPNNASVLLGNGAGGFAAPAAVNCGSGQDSLAIADMDLDGRLDLIVGTLTNTVLLRGNGNGTFQAPVTIAPGASDDVTVGDLNGDGRPDVATVLYSADSLTITLNNGGGTFAAPTTFATGDGPLSVNIADINRDGATDIIVGHGIALVTRLYLGRNDGTFWAVPFAGISGAAQQRIVDLNSDGYPDIAGASVASNAVISILQNPAAPAPTFAAQPTSISVVNGQPANFTINAANNAWTIRWRRNGALLSNTPPYSGVDTPTLSIASATPADSGAIFDCILTNGCGSVTSACASLLVTAACPADFNASGIVSVQDIFDFLAAYFAGCP